MTQKGARTICEQAGKSKILWTEFCQAEPHCIKVLVYTVCTTGIWWIHQHAFCGREKGPSSLFCCPKALGECWCLSGEIIAESICGGIASCQKSTPMKEPTNFISAGEKTRLKVTSSQLLNTAQDWQLSVDLSSQLKCPQHIAKRPLSDLTSFWCQRQRRMLSCWRSLFSGKSEWRRALSLRQFGMLTCCLWREGGEALPDSRHYRREEESHPQHHRENF